MTDEDSTPNSAVNSMEHLQHDPLSLDFTGKHLIVSMHSETFAGLAEAAVIARSSSVADFVLHAAWEKARELRQPKT